MNSLLLAASAPANNPAWPDMATGAGILALGAGVLALIFFLYLCYLAIFVHLASKITGHDKPFGTALKAVLINLVLHVALGVLVALLLADSSRAQVGIAWAASTLAIMVAYKTGIFAAFITAVLALILTIVGTVITVIALVVLLGLPLQPPSQPAPQPQPKDPTLIEARIDTPHFRTYTNSLTSHELHAT